MELDFVNDDKPLFPQHKCVKLSAILKLPLICQLTQFLSDDMMLRLKFPIGNLSQVSLNFRLTIWELSEDPIKELGYEILHYFYFLFFCKSYDYFGCTCSGKPNNRIAANLDASIQSGDRQGS